MTLSKVGTIGMIADVQMGQSPIGSSYNSARAGAPLINGPTEFTNRYPVAKQWTTRPVRFSKRGDILICVRGSSTGRMNTSDIEYCIGRGVAAVRARGNNDQQYVFHALTAVVAQLLKMQAGSTFPSIDSKVIRGGEILIPSLAEQRALSASLDGADELIASLERLIAKKQAIKQGMMQQLLTGKTRLSGFADDWGQESLGELSTMRSGGTPDSKTAAYFGGGFPWVSISDMSSGGRYLRGTEKTLSQTGLDSSAATLYDTGVVLYAMYASIGECCIAVGRMSSSQAILGITPSRRLNHEFLFYFLTYIKPQVREMGQQGTQSNLNAGMVRKFQIPLPPLAEQEQIVRVLGDVDEEIDALKHRLASSRAIKQGMMQELLTGRTRLIPVGESE